MTTVTLEKEEYDTLIKTNSYYKEVIDTYDALKTAKIEKQEGKIKKLNSLADLI